MDIIVSITDEQAASLEDEAIKTMPADQRTAKAYIEKMAISYAEAISRQALSVRMQSMTVKAITTALDDYDAKLK